ncbi:uncharacterized protein CC84DRAFT_1179008 [Paraphaeosphaeria sporulosa]|uniref:WSC domain-containing protein n=1 Tax=Paraphaeosphaeria sporulosa TaxID=1460663 RepID=A0A177C5K1_9PLEO|nr:uncharacterized protein CC84DRAFT_1179008 [Paraphaeosphaeria sporulosa]OAG02048.1 hypothetical protein CC84DRAFT_1179008 [Paraphaeosphaeria sporulosa]
MKLFAWIVASLTAESLAFKAELVAPLKDLQNLAPRAEEATDLISGWRDLGCWSDDGGNLTLGDLTTGGYVLQKGAFVQFYDTSSTPNSPDVCMTYCNNNGYTFAGVEYGFDCLCSSRAPDTARSGQTGCNVACPNPNGAQTCGGGNRIQIYTNDKPYPYSQPKTSGLQTNWSYQGCYTTSGSSRVLVADSTNLQSSGNGATQCIDYCNGKGYSLAGTGNGYECWCDNAIQGGNSLDSTPNQCVQPCAQNTGEGCGSPQRQAVYARQTERYCGGGEIQLLAPGVPPIVQ